MAKPNTYNLGAIPEIRLLTVDINGEVVYPDEARLSIEIPDGTIVTVSGAAMTEGNGYLAYPYEPEEIGYFKYEGWVKDGSGREGASAHGFYVTNRVE